MSTVRERIGGIVNKLGYSIAPLIQPDMEQEFLDIYQECKEYTVTSIYIEENNIEGDIVECGVWKGGSMMLCALTLKALGNTNRNIYLYDTYKGMTEPTSKDINYKNEAVIMPDKVSILRLDTDWYESTYHELLHLYPRLSIDGVLIIDDYGHFMGAKEAVDKYIKDNGIRILLNRIDYTGRISIKGSDK